MQTVTIAPEAGSQRLRELIKKGICEDDILRVVTSVAERKMKQLNSILSSVCLPRQMMISKNSETESSDKKIY